jgi:ZIP family zinc transporter
VTEELLVRAHNLGDTPLVTALFFLGFVVVFIGGLLV